MFVAKPICEKHGPKRHYVEGDQRNRYRCLECIKDRYNSDKEYRKKKLSQRRNHDYPFKKYNMTLADFDRMLESQGGACAICGTTESIGRGRLHVDHNHNTGKVRGLLCSNCNCGIGYLKESVGMLSKAIQYLSERDG